MFVVERRGYRRGHKPHILLYFLESRRHVQVKQLRIDKQVLEAHEAATGALKACREAQGLTVERVEDTLDALAEVD